MATTTGRAQSAPEQQSIHDETGALRSARSLSTRLWLSKHQRMDYAAMELRLLALLPKRRR